MIRFQFSSCRCVLLHVNLSYSSSAFNLKETKYKTYRLVRLDITTLLLNHVTIVIGIPIKHLA